MKKKLKVVGLIPTRLNSSRLPQKAILLIHKIPLVVHTYRRAKMSKKLDDLYICCDDEKIYKTVKTTWTKKENSYSYIIKALNTVFNHKK